MRFALSSRTTFRAMSTASHIIDTQSYTNKCIEAYRKIVSANPKIDADHSVLHVITVANTGRAALTEFLKTRTYLPEELLTSIYIPDDVVLRTDTACLLHEVGDTKFADEKSKPKEELISEILDEVFICYPSYTPEMKNDIINMIDYCTSSKWGDRMPENVKIYQLIPRWADRLEATGIIGIARALLYGYSKITKNYPLCEPTDPYPTTLEELVNFASSERYLAYSKGKPSTGTFGHFFDKLLHINGINVPISYLKNSLNNGQTIIQQFVLDFTNKNNKKYNIDWVCDNLDPVKYSAEILQLREMQKHLRALNNPKWA